MTQRQFDLDTVKQLMQFAYPDSESSAIKPYEIREDGAHVSEAFRQASVNGAVPIWTPARSMKWSGAPNPNLAPFLPANFIAEEFGAAILCGVGAGIQDALDRRIGYPLDEDDEALEAFRESQPWMYEAIIEAYRCVAEAQLVVGEFDYEMFTHVRQLQRQYHEANEQANAGEGVFSENITQEESRARREKAVAYVKDFKQRAEQAEAELSLRWREWLDAMVRQLLNPAASAAGKKKHGLERKLNDEQRAAVVRIYKNLKKIAPISRQFGVNDRTISDILIAAGVKEGKPRRTPKEEKIGVLETKYRAGKPAE